ncbi:hypothetical protein D3C81_2216130 [compost metagenome]
MPKLSLVSMDMRLVPLPSYERNPLPSMMIRLVADDVWIVEPVIVEALINPLNSPLVVFMWPVVPSTVNAPLPTLM